MFALYTYMCYNSIVNMKRVYSKDKKDMKDVLIDTRVIREFLAKNDMSLHKFAKLSNIKLVTLYHVLRNFLDKVSIVDIYKIAGTMHCSIEELIIDLTTKY